MITARRFSFYLLWKHIGVGAVCISKISIIVHIIQLNHGIPGWLRWEETSGCHLDSLQYLCVSLALGSPGLDPVLYVWLEQGGRISCLDLLPSPSSPESCQPSLTQGLLCWLMFSPGYTALAHQPLLQPAVIGILAEDKLCPIIQTMNKDVKQDWCFWSPTRLCSTSFCHI